MVAAAQLTSQMNHHRWFEVMPSAGHRQQIEEACRVLIDLMYSRADWLVIDAVSDLRRLMPEDVRRVEDELVEFGRLRKKRRIEMGIRIPFGEESVWNQARNYAPWSIHVEIYGHPHGDVIATMHDCGASMSFFGTDTDADVLNEKLRGGAIVRRRA